MDKPWLLDSGASHTITSDLANLTTHSEYDDTDEVTLGDGSGLEISHTGSLSLKFPKKIFCFPDTLCSISLQNFNLSSSSHKTQ
jgi:hypothetical protein